MDIDCVIIGINAEATLGECLRSVLGSRYERGSIRVYYVDGGSSDRSPDIAREFPGVNVISVDMEHPTPGRGRNAGWRAGSSPLVQFLDSDTVMDPEWLDRAVDALADNVGAVCGRRQEIHPEASVFNWIADLEWNGSAGESDAFGGDVLIRRQALTDTDGYDDELVGGEDPELSQRIREKGWAIMRLDEAMTRHDLGMKRVSQYWRRAYRTGYAFAAVTARHGRKAGHFWLRDLVRIIGRAGCALALFLLAALGAFAVHPAALLLCVPALLLLLSPRLFRARHFSTDKQLSRDQAAVYAWHCSLVVVPQFFGVARFLVGSLTGRPLRNRRHALKTRVSKTVASLQGAGAALYCVSCRTVEPYARQGSEFERKVFTVGERPRKATRQKKVVSAPARTSVVRPEPVGELPTPDAQLASVLAFSNSVSDTYVLGPGDVIELKVWAHPELSDSEIIVAPDGTISILRAGVMNVRGRTVQDVTNEIITKFRELYEQPEISVAVKRYVNNKVFVLGQVTRPGVVDFPGHGTLIEALTRAGGLQKQANGFAAERCCVVRKGKTPVWIDLEALLRRGEMSLNVRLQNNDVVFVPEPRETRVYVVGEVKTPGPHMLRTPLSYVDAVMLSGGPTKYANRQQTFIIRAGGDGKGELIVIDLSAILKTGDRSADVRLQDTDIIYVPKRKLAQFGDVVSMLTPGLEFFNLSLEILEKVGVMAELREQLWGQTGFVDSN